MLHVQLYENYFHKPTGIYARLTPKIRSLSQSKQHNNDNLNKQTTNTVFVPLIQSLYKCTMSKSLLNFLGKASSFLAWLLGADQSKLGNKNMSWHLTRMCGSGKWRCKTSQFVMTCQMACLG